MIKIIKFTPISLDLPSEIYPASNFTNDPHYSRGVIYLKIAN